MSARVFLHPTTTASPLDVTRIELRTGSRAYWTGRHAELMPVDEEWWRAELPAVDYAGEQPKGAA